MYNVHRLWRTKIARCSRCLFVYMAMPHVFLCVVLPVSAAMDEEESGWKYVHGDVFRYPPMKNLFTAFVGTGTQVCAEISVCFVYVSHTAPEICLWTAADAQYMQCVPITGLLTFSVSEQHLVQFETLNPGQNLV